MTVERPCEQLYFLHIPKTAGTSLRVWLGDLFGAKDWLPCHNLNQLKELTPDQINKYRFFSGHFSLVLPERLDSQLPTITWLREPIARAESHHRYIDSNYDELTRVAHANNRPDWIDHWDAIRKMSLTELCQSKRYLGFSDNLQVRHLAGKSDKSGYIECDQAMLETARQNLVNMLHFGICEWMEPSIDLLCYRLRYLRRKMNLKMNRTKGKQHRGVSLSESDQRIVCEANRFDAELYQFAVQLFHDRLAELWDSIPGATAITPDQLLQQYARPEYQALIEQQLKKNFLNDRSVQTMSPRPIVVDFADPIYLNGWYPRYEFSEGQFIRWGGPHNYSTIYAPLSPTLDYQLRFDVLHMADTGVVDSMHLNINGHDLPLQSRLVESRDGRRMVRMTTRIPGKCVANESRLSEVTIQCQQTYEQKPQFDAPRQVTFTTDKFQFLPVGKAA